MPLFAFLDCAGTERAGQASARSSGSRDPRDRALARQCDRHHGAQFAQKLGEPERAGTVENIPGAAAASGASAWRNRRPTATPYTGARTAR